MEFGISPNAFWYWIAAWTLLPLLTVFMIWGYRQRKRQGEMFGRLNTLYRIFPEDIWKDRIDARRAKFGDQNQVARDVRKGLRHRWNTRAVLVILAMICMMLALGKPRWGIRQEEVYKQGIDMMLVVDTSLSMKSQDVAPNRLDKARSEISSLLDQLENNRVGLVGFASTTRLHCPLTLDFRGLRSILDHSLSWGKGTNIENAVAEALRVLGRSEVPSRAIVVLSDGEGHEGDLNRMIEMARSADVRIFCIGVGTTEGGPIPDDQNQDSTGYKKAGGEIVWTRLVEEDLQRIARETGGEYYRATDTELETTQLARQIQDMEKTRFSQTVTTRKEEQFAYLLLLAVLFLALEAGLGDIRVIAWEHHDERLKTKLAELLMLCAILPVLCGFHWWDPIARWIGIGNEAYRKEQYEEAEKAYRKAEQTDADSPAVQNNLGDALYRMGKMDEAVEKFDLAAKMKSGDDRIRSRAEYNKGCVHLQAGDYQGAWESFRNALMLNPDDPEAKANLEITRRIMENMPTPTPPPQSQDRQKDQSQNQEDEQENQPTPESSGTEQPTPRSDQSAQQETATPTPLTKPEALQPGDSGPTPENQPTAEPVREGMMSSEEAQRLLDALEEEEMEVLKRFHQLPESERPVEKDW